MDAGGGGRGTASDTRPAESTLMCKNWDIGVMRRRYRSEELQVCASCRYEGRGKNSKTGHTVRKACKRVHTKQQLSFELGLSLFLYVVELDSFTSCCTKATWEMKAKSGKRWLGSR